MKKFFKEFKTFISKGNVFDMAVGLIIATAFNKIVSSLVNDIIMPLVTWATCASSLSDLSVPLKYGLDANGNQIVTLSWAYGNFIQTILDFLIIAFSVFLMVKVVTSSRKKFQELGALVQEQSSKEVRTERKLMRQKAKIEKRSFREVWKEHEEAKKKLAEEKALLEADEKARKELEDKINNPTETELLKQIRDLLKENNKADKE